MFLLQSNLSLQYDTMLEQLNSSLSHLPNRDGLWYQTFVDMTLIINSGDGIIVCSEVGELSFYESLQKAHEDMLYVGYDRVMFYGESNDRVRQELENIQGEWKDVR